MDHNAEIQRILKTGMRVQIRGTSSGFSVWVDGAPLGDVETIDQAIELLQDVTERREALSISAS